MKSHICNRLCFGRRAVNGFLVFVGLLVSPVLRGQAANGNGESLPLFELEGLEVVYSQTGFSPAFSVDSPQFSFYETPKLPRGELILCLEFMDQYRDNAIPGPVKWGALLHFPIIDGYERNHLKWICLYYYDGRMFGYDPMAKNTYEKRFYVPIRYEDRTNPDVLYRFAESFVESVYPGGIEAYYIEEVLDADDPDLGVEETVEYIDIDPGRIAGFLPSHKGKDAPELVKMPYQFSLDPNPTPGADVQMGPAEDFGKRPPFSWAGLWSDLSKVPDPIEVAQALVAPRWSQVALFYYPQEILLLWKFEAKEKVLLFNIGQRIYAYDPEFGVWRTNATVQDLANQDELVTKLGYPGVKSLARIEFVEDEGPKTAIP